ncbi:DMT family transporter [Sediminicoccus sp. KRV36]|uniref:DMT family transporter n=1 Tax=Sediminicoccus sp. KRV36 TaxID=3133721 RepID=UPI00200FBFDF|nr:DMT family transporter [Sediminicoccus rosea]UPY39189.1 DMT family transporter [Sediminicoccus rosea]
MTPRQTGLMLLMMTAVNWGATWPVLKFLLTELPPLSMRALGSGTLAVLLALGAMAFRISLHVPPAQRRRLVLYALLNITAWMAFGTLALRWLSASEAAILAYTMPVWAALFAWPILGEKPGPARLAGLALGFGSIIVLFAGRGVELGLAKLPGLLFILASALLFALGAVLSKRRPLVLHPITALAWQMAIGCVPMAVLAPLLESFHPALVTPPVWFWFGWFMIFSMGLSYLTWFGALARLPASTAAIGTLLAPVLSVLGAGLFLGEPLGWREALALSGTLAAVALAVGVRDKPR